MVEEKKNKTKSFKMLLKTKTRNFFVNIFTYSTVRSATIQSLKVGVAYRFAQLVLLSYIIGFFNYLIYFHIRHNLINHFYLKMGAYSQQRLSKIRYSIQCCHNQSERPRVCAHKRQIKQVNNKQNSRLL